jgi:hypothetical protein
MEDRTGATPQSIQQLVDVGPFLGPLRPSCRLLWNVADVTRSLRNYQQFSYKCPRENNEASVIATLDDTRVLRQLHRSLHRVPPLARANDERSTWYHCFDSLCLLLRRWSTCTWTLLIRTEIGPRRLYYMHNSNVTAPTLYISNNLAVKWSLMHCSTINVLMASPPIGLHG